jgi:hypothetical protein
MERLWQAPGCFRKEDRIMSETKLVSMLRSHRRLTMSMVLALAGLGLAGPGLGLAQQTSPPAPTVPPADCTVPSQGGQHGAGGTSAGQIQKGPRNLADCNGVLRPPAVGDQDLVEPAPPTGQMPVIRPGDLPQGNATPGTGG